MTTVNIPPTTLGSRIRNAREWRRLEQTQLAELMEVSRPTISNWERMANLPRLRDVKRLAEVLDVDLEWLETGGSVTHR